MITQTIREAIMVDDEPAQGYVYVARNGEDVLYIGLSQRPILRLQQHLGVAGAWRKADNSGAVVELLTGWGTQYIRERPPLMADQLGECIFSNAPGSLDWTFDIYELDDAIAVLERAGY